MTDDPRAASVRTSADGLVPSATIDQILGLSGRGGIPAGTADPEIADILTAPIDRATIGPARRAAVAAILLGVARGTPIGPLLLNRLATLLDGRGCFTIACNTHAVIRMCGLSPARIAALSLALPGVSFHHAGLAIRLAAPDAATGAMAGGIVLEDGTELADDELLLDATLPDTVLNAAPGVWLANLVSHPMLDGLPLRIAAAGRAAVDARTVTRILLEPRRRVFLRSLIDELQ